MLSAAGDGGSSSLTLWQGTVRALTYRFPARMNGFRLHSGVRIPKRGLLSGNLCRAPRRRRHGELCAGPTTPGVIGSQKQVHRGYDKEGKEGADGNTRRNDETHVVTPLGAGAGSRNQGQYAQDHRCGRH